MIAEGSDGTGGMAPSITRNDRDLTSFTASIFRTSTGIGTTPPDYLTQPITGGEVRPRHSAERLHSSPRAGDKVRLLRMDGSGYLYRRSARRAMHGKQFCWIPYMRGSTARLFTGGWILPVRCRRWPLIWW